ncbi:MAG: hypothetical protein HY243_00825 [Proteobacteria bacterium]|nr:hypothetical protein [Pseudomonadota bacterium]
MNGFRAKAVLLGVSLIVTAFALTAATGFVCVGLFLFIGEYVSPVAAAFLTAASILLFAFFLLLIPRLVSKMSSTRRRRESESRPAMNLGALLGGELLKLAESKAPTVIAVSLVAGFAVGLSPRLREFLFDLARS